MNIGEEEERYKQFKQLNIHPLGAQTEIEKELRSREATTRINYIQVTQIQA